MSCELHDQFIRARENLEVLEHTVRGNVMADTPIVCGTSGVLMKHHLQCTYDLGDRFGAMVTDEASMPEAGEEIAKTMNLVQQNILEDACKKTLIGDVTQEGPSGSVQHSCWSAAEYLQYSSLPMSIFTLIFRVFTDVPRQEWFDKVVFVNRTRSSDLVNALVNGRLLSLMTSPTGKFLHISLGGNKKLDPRQ